MTLPRIAIALGDPAGIGPEIALKAALDPRVRALCRPLLVGDPAVLALQARLCGLEGRLAEVPLLQVPAEPPVLGEIRAAHGRAAVEAARAAIAAALRGEVDAVVAAPQTERAIKEAGIDFDGYPSFVARCAGLPAEDGLLMLCFDRTRIVHATLHVSLARAIALLTRERVGKVIAAADGALRRLGIAAPRLAVAGLNPHAGEHGLFGEEDETVVRPAVARAASDGLDIAGPFGADALLAGGGYDVYLAMYHDQAHIPIKLLGIGASSGMPIGTPVLFSSVPHGSAFDIVGKNQANPAAIVTTLKRLAAVSRS
jgi:4-hydroxy-L-threonine phosphate dehydrogenase PdxA